MRTSGSVRAAISRRQTTKQINMKSETDTIISALRVLARDIHTDDGVVNACLEEAANRLEELQRELKQAIAEKIPPGYGLLNDQIKHLKEQMGYMQQALGSEIADGKKARDEVDVLKQELAETIRERDKTVANLIKQRDDSYAEIKTVRKELAQAIAERTPHDYGLLKGEVDNLKRELSEAIKERNKPVADLIKQRDEAIASARPDPSRLEIAALLLAATYASNHVVLKAAHALQKADELIAAVKEAK